ncbi:terminase family protein [Clostridium sp. KNHs205]|uniref:terminase large subunit domain-containing protein n=1 Tax=Clostridium sp. KNHs205 TaxID=1449050 RepID=UPI00051AC2A0|nr:terminase family protein [Clostridium sp. KNHs205]
MILSPKQMEFVANANHRYNVKTGATRSGKSYMDNLYTIPGRIRERQGKDGLNALIGVSKGTIERNILQPMREIYGSRLIGDIGSDNIVDLFGDSAYCLGAEKVSQVAKLRGSSLKYVYGDEVAEWNQQVFELLKSRMDKSYSCFDGACNPDNPNHWFKKFLDSDADIYCQKYTIFDNPYLPPEFVENLCNEYKGTVYYDRYIRGLWVAAEGAVYKLFNDAQAQLINPFKLTEKPKSLMEINIGVDFGGSGSGHAFVATGYGRGYTSLIGLASEWIDCSKNDIDPEKLGQLFVDFCLKVLNIYGFITQVNCDSAEQTLISGLRSTARKSGLGWLRINNALKTAVNDRIRFTQRMMGQGRFYYVPEHCKSLELALCGALWNPKNLTEDERLDDGTSDIDTLDGFEYGFERDISRFIRYE